MKKNFYYLSLLLGLVLGMTMFTACGGDDDNGGASGGGTSDGGAGGFTPGKFMGPKRVFGDNLLSSFGEENNSNWYLTYNSDGFVTKIKRESFFNNQLEAVREYEVSYSDKQVTINRTRSGSERIRQYVITIGVNGFAESCTMGYLDSDNKDVYKFEYDTEGHLLKATDEDDKPGGGIFTWQNGNIISQTAIGDSEGSCSYTYTDISNVAGLQITAYIGSMDDLYLPELFYMGLLGKSTANLVKSYSYSDGSYTRTGENVWTLDDAGRPTKCVRTSTYSDNNYIGTSTYFWTYR